MSVWIGAYEGGLDEWQVVPGIPTAVQHLAQWGLFASLSLSLFGAVISFPLASNLSSCSLACVWIFLSALLTSSERSSITAKEEEEAAASFLFLSERDAYLVWSGIKAEAHIAATTMIPRTRVSEDLLRIASLFFSPDAREENERKEHDEKRRQNLHAHVWIASSFLSSFLYKFVWVCVWGGMECGDRQAHGEARRSGPSVHRSSITLGSIRGQWRTPCGVYALTLRVYTQCCILFYPSPCGRATCAELNGAQGLVSPGKFRHSSPFAPQLFKLKLRVCIKVGSSLPLWIFGAPLQSSPPSSLHSFPCDRMAEETDARGSRRAPPKHTHLARASAPSFSNSNFFFPIWWQISFSRLKIFLARSSQSWGIHCFANQANIFHSLSLLRSHRSPFCSISFLFFLYKIFDVVTFWLPIRGHKDILIPTICMFCQTWRTWVQLLMLWTHITASSRARNKWLRRYKWISSLYIKSTYTYSRHGFTHIFAWKKKRKISRRLWITKTMTATMI